MAQFVSRWVRSGLGRADFACEHPVARGSERRDWLEKATSAGQYDAIGGLVVVPADRLGVASKRRLYDVEP
jgi:hypothetical protein